MLKRHTSAHHNGVRSNKLMLSPPDSEKLWRVALISSQVFFWAVNSISRPPLSCGKLRVKSLWCRICKESAPLSPDSALFFTDCVNGVLHDGETMFTTWAHVRKHEESVVCVVDPISDDRTVPTVLVRPIFAIRPVRISNIPLLNPIYSFPKTEYSI